MKRLLPSYSMKTRPKNIPTLSKSESVESLSDPIRDPKIICPFSIPTSMVAADHGIPSIVENVFHDAINDSVNMMQRRSRPQRTPWGPGPNYKEVWKTSSLQRREGGVSSSEQPPRFNASLPPRRPSPPMSPLLAPLSSSLYDEFYPWRGEDIQDSYCTASSTRKDPPCFNEDFEYLYVADMRSTMGKHCALIFTDSVSWLSKKRCPKRCRVYVIPGVHLAINDLFKNKFEWSKIAVNEMWHSRQNNCKEVCHRHKHNANHIIRNLIISKSPIPRMN